MGTLTKKCRKCRRILPASDENFYRIGVGKHHRRYLSSYCKRCQNIKRSRDRGYKPKSRSVIRMIGAAAVS